LGHTVLVVGTNW